MQNIRGITGWLGVLALTLVFTAGCPDDSGKRTAHLRGTVTIDGQPIPDDAESVIIFWPTSSDQSRSTSTRITDGRFDVLDAPLGTVRIEFRIEQPTGEIAAFEPGARPEMRYRSLVPDEHTAGMTIEVDGDIVDLKLDL